MASIADTVLRGTDQVANAYGVLGQHNTRERALKEQRRQRAWDGLNQNLQGAMTFQKEKRAEDEARGLSDAFLAGLASGDTKAAWRAIEASPATTRESAKIKADLGLKVMDVAQTQQSMEHQRLTDELLKEASDIKKRGRLAVSDALAPVDEALPPTTPEGSIDIESSLFGMGAATSPNVTVRRDPTQDEVVQRLAAAGQLGPDDLMRYYEKQIPLDVADKNTASREAIAAQAARDRIALEAAKRENEAEKIRLRAEEARKTAQAAFDMKRPLEERKVAAAEIAAKASAGRASAAEISALTRATKEEFDQKKDIQQFELDKAKALLQATTSNLEFLRKVGTARIVALVADGMDLEDAYQDPLVVEQAKDLAEAIKSSADLRETLTKLEGPTPSGDKVDTKLKAKFDALTPEQQRTFLEKASPEIRAKVGR